MGSQLEGFIGMMCIAVVGGAVAALVLATKSPIALTGFAYVATHLLAAAILIVPFSIVCVLAKLDPPPFAGLWSMLLLVVIPAVVSLILSTNYYWPNPTSRLTIRAAMCGAIASPFLLLGIGGSAIESWMTRDKRDRTNKGLDVASLG